MKIGCCVNMLADSSDPIGRRYLPLLKELRYDYAELPLAQVMDLSDRQFDGLLEEMNRLELPCECCNNLFPAFLRLTGEYTAPPGVVNAYLQKAMGRAAALGASRVIFGSSGAKNIPEGFPYEKAYEQLVQAAALVAEAAEREGIVVGLEPLNALESNLILNLSESSRLMETVNLPQIRLMVDCYHFRMEKDSMEVLEKWADAIVHIHIASPRGRSFPEPEDLGIVSFLKNKGYEGGVSIEAFSDDPCRDLAAGRSVFLNTLAV